MKHSILFLLVLGLISLGCSGKNKAAESSSNTAQPGSSSEKSAAENPNVSPNSSTTANATSDQKFVEDAIKGNRAEVTLGKMVVSKTKDPNVKQFAQMMVKDHTQALSQLQQLAQQKNIAVPDGMPDDAQQLQSKLQGESGKQFDKDYMDGMVQDHEKDVQEFQEQAQKAKDPDVKQLASQLLPTLQQHLDKAQQIDASVNGSSGKPSGE